MIKPDLVLSYFKNINIAFSERYGARWTDGTQSHYQSLGRAWMPALAKELNESQLSTAIENFRSDKSLFKSSPPDVSEFIAFAQSDRSTSIKNLRFDDPLKHAVHQVILKSVIDYNSFTYKGSENIQDHLDLVDSWYDRIIELGEISGEDFKSAYKRFVSNSSNKTFPPRLIELYHLAKDINKLESINLELYASVSNFHSMLFNRYGKYFAGDVDDKQIIKEWYGTLSDYDIHDVEKLNRVIDEIRRDSKYTNNPPKIINVVERYYTTGMDLPDENEAFQQAIGNKGASIHPLVSYVRKKFGVHNLLRNGSDFTKRDFQKLYHETSIEYARGKLTLKQDVQTEQPHDPVVDKKDGSSLIKKLKDKI